MPHVSTLPSAVYMWILLDMVWFQRHQIWIWIPNDPIASVIDSKLSFGTGSVFKLAQILFLLSAICSPIYNKAIAIVINLRKRKLLVNLSCWIKVGTVLA